jgi:nitroreductase
MAGANSTHGVATRGVTLNHVVQIAPRMAPRIGECDMGSRKLPCHAQPTRSVDGIGLAKLRHTDNYELKRLQWFKWLNRYHESVQCREPCLWRHVMATSKRTAVLAAAGYQAAPATAGELVPGNIESATRIGEDLVVVKLRRPRPAPTSEAITIKIGAPQAQLRMIGPRELDQALSRAVRRLTTAAQKIDVAANRAFMDQLGRQEQARRAQLIQDGELIDTSALAERLAISVQAISRACRENRMFALEGASGRLLYPAFYADPDLSRSALGRVSKLLGDLPPSAKWQFFTTPKQTLKRRTPLEALKKGQIAEVELSARGFRER